MTRQLMCILGASCVLLVAFAEQATAQTRQSSVGTTGFRDEQILDDTLLRQGRIEVSILSAGMWSSDSGESGDGDISSSGSTFYANPAIAAGYMVLDNLQVRLTPGYLMISTTSNDVALQDFGGFFGSLQALYHVPFRYGTAFYLGGGGGYFVGSTDRPGAEENTTISNSTSGFAGQGVAGLLLQPGPMLLLRGGIRFDALSGSETSSAEDLPDISAKNLKLMGEFAVGLRFN